MFDARRPFSKSEQLTLHAETIACRRQLGSVESALADERFMGLLYRTLQAWGIGVRGSTLKPFPEFEGSIRAQAGRIADLEGFTIDQKDLLPGGVHIRLWELISSLGVVSNKALIVAGTKTLHHVLPELVVPIDRMYTGTFFRRQPPQFQQNQDRLFKLIFRDLHRVAEAVQPSSYVGEAWRSSRTKVIDNAVVGYCLAEGLVP